MALPLSRKVHVLLAQFHVSLVDDFRDDVRAVAQVVVDEVGLAVLHLVHGELLLSVRLDVGELVVVINRLDSEGLFALEDVVELERKRVGALVFVYRLGDVTLESESCSRVCANCAAGTYCAGPVEAVIEDRSAGWMMTFRSGSPPWAVMSCSVKL